MSAKYLISKLVVRTGEEGVGGGVPCHSSAVCWAAL